MCFERKYTSTSAVTHTVCHRHKGKIHLALQVEDLIQSTLEELAETGFSTTAIEAALNTTEFHLRENNTGRFPRGLSLMLRAMGNWIYDKDPYEALQWTQALDHFKVCQWPKYP